MSSKGKGAKGKTKGKGKGAGSNAKNEKGNTKPVGGGARQNSKKFEFADASKFAEAVTMLRNDTVSDAESVRGPTNLRFARPMHVAWTKHLAARKVIVDDRVASYTGSEDDYDGIVGLSALQRAEDELYRANQASYDNFTEIFNEKYPDLSGQYAEEAPTKNSLGEQVESLREQVTTMQTGLATFQEQVLTMLTTIIDDNNHQEASSAGTKRPRMDGSAS